jgi:mono/diheme cytochrome c family protein
MKSGIFIFALTSLLSITASASQKTEVIARGSAVYQANCEACHGIGIGRNGTAALERKYLGTLPAVLTDRRDLTPEFVKVIVRNGISFMPRFRKTEISDQDLAALGRYLSKRAK